EVVLGDAARQRGLDDLHLFGDAEVALAVAEVSDDRPHGVMDLPDVLTEEFGRADPLHVAPGIQGHERGHGLLAAHGGQAYGRPCAGQAGVGNGVEAGVGVTSIPNLGIDRSIQRGSHQLTGPSTSMIDGTSTMRTSVASISTAVASPRPNTLRMWSGS